MIVGHSFLTEGVKLPIRAQMRSLDYTAFIVSLVITSCCARFVTISSNAKDECQLTCDVVDDCIGRPRLHVSKQEPTKEFCAIVKYIPPGKKE